MADSALLRRIPAEWDTFKVMRDNHGYQDS